LSRWELRSSTGEPNGVVLRPRGVRRLLAGGLGAALVLAAAGCGANVAAGPGATPSPSSTPSTRDAVTEHEQTWEGKEPSAYAFTLRYGSMIGSRSARVRVADGRVVSVSRVRGEQPFRDFDKAVTVDGVFDLVRADLRRADHVRVTYDPTWGFPASVAVDEMSNAIDDEHGYAISDFTPGAKS
jgi:hypothetical protein